MQFPRSSPRKSPLSNRFAHASQIDRNHSTISDSPYMYTNIANGIYSKLIQGARDIVQTMMAHYHPLATATESHVLGHVDKVETNMDSEVEADPHEQHVADEVVAMAQPQPPGGRLDRFNMSREERLARIAAHSNISKAERMKKYISKLKLRQKKHVERLRDKKRKRLDRIAQRCRKK